jgi:nucleoside-diphosphate-sugar epimerase
MRFDLAINGMVKGFFQNRKIPILRDGTQWRPFVHVKDTSRAMILLLQHQAGPIAGQRFNVGSNDQNYKVFDLAKLVAESAGIPFDYEWYGDPDHRSYQIDFSKAKKVLGFEPVFSPRKAVTEIWTALENGSLDPNALNTITLKWYKKLIDERVKIGLESQEK